MHKVAFIFGSRPEAIKLAPVILAMREAPGLSPHVCVTAQHRQLLDQMLEMFAITPDVDLDLMEPDQSLAGFTSRAVGAIDAYLAGHRPEMVIIQGDTTTTLCAALCAYYRRIPVAHVEAGLRTGEKFSPFPEEMNRVLAGRLADYHFAPTARARQNLLKEGVADARIFVTGNTVVDALHIALRAIGRQRPRVQGLPEGLMGDRQAPMVLITGHRRESFGPGFERICQAVTELARRFPTANFVCPVHLNPNVRKPVLSMLGGLANVHLTGPQPYLAFVSLMERATAILTDSGGVQEEALSLGKPVLVMRETTERPEGMEAGAAKLVGTDAAGIVDGVSLILGGDGARLPVTAEINPYGDGHASARIVEACRTILNE
jgi:UDP-N-acetylglucosamine 2-epimerase (non-hydrolysing)